MNEEEIEKRLLKIEAVHAIQTADVGALLALLGEIHKNLLATFPDLPVPDDRFLYWRKKLLHFCLETLEQTNPEYAAKLQQAIDESSVNYPFDYDED
jgi:hypothetical protein